MLVPSTLRFSLILVVESGLVSDLHTTTRFRRVVLTRLHHHQAAMGSTVDVFDYIIIGGGTAGLTVANRLTEDADIRVLVIEAGQDRTKDPLVQIPGLVVGMYGKPEYDWNLRSTPQVSKARMNNDCRLDIGLTPSPAGAQQPYNQPGARQAIGRLFCSELHDAAVSSKG